MLDQRALGRRQQLRRMLDLGKALAEVDGSGLARQARNAVEHGGRGRAGQSHRHDLPERIAGGKKTLSYKAPAVPASARCQREAFTTPGRRHAGRAALAGSREVTVFAAKVTESAAR
jgi:hypothetical protein